MSRATVASLVLTSLFAPNLWAQANCSGSQLNFPRLSLQQDQVTGVAVFNPNGVEAEITLTAYDAQGGLLAVTGPGAANPAEGKIPKGEQFAQTAGEIFGAAVDPSAPAWFQVCSSTPDLTGFFLFLDFNPTTFLDGSDLPVASQTIVFPDIRVDAGRATEINIINPGASAAVLSLQVFAGNLMPVAQMDMVNVNAKGVLRFEVKEFFPELDLPLEGRLVASSDQPIAGFELVGPASPSGAGPALRETVSYSPATPSARPDLLGLTASPVIPQEELKTLYFPQLAVGQDIDTQISITNLGKAVEVVSVSAYDPDGRLWDPGSGKTNPAGVQLAIGETKLLDARDLFFSDQTLRQGWIKVEAQRPSLYGSVSYSLGDSFAAVAAAPARKFAVFSHLATTQGFFTGVAGLNAGAYPANVKIIAMKQTGARDSLGEYQTTLLPDQRFSKVITEQDVIPGATGESRGIVWVRSDVPIYLTSLFGTTTPGNPLPDVLANVPPQPVPEAYRPDGEKDFLDIQVEDENGVFVSAGGQLPFLTDEMRNFKADEAGISWFVNNLETPPAELGTLISTPPPVKYKAPATPPTPPSVTINAKASSGNVGSASVDVLVLDELNFRFAELQSLVHLQGLNAVFSAELFAAGASVAETPAGASMVTRVFEVGEPSELVRQFPGVISRMLPYQACDGNEYLILADQTTGRVLRLQAVTDAPPPYVVQCGAQACSFNNPTTMDFDVIGNSLVVADMVTVHSISSGALDGGLTCVSNPGPSDNSVVKPRTRLQRRAPPGREGLRLFAPLQDSPQVLKRMSARPEIGLFRRERTPLTDQFPAGSPGIVFDQCTGDLFVSDPVNDSILQLDRSTGEVTRRFQDILQPGQLLGFYRREVGCPNGFNILVTERGRDRILLLNPERGSRTRFAPINDGRDLAFLPQTSNFSLEGTVLIAQGTTGGGAGAPAGDGGGRLIRVDVPNLWRTAPPNPPRICPGSFLLKDTTLHSAVTAMFGLDPSDRIPCGQAAQLTELEVAGAGVRDLGNIGFFTNLTELSLPNNLIRDVTPLADLPGLLNLDLSGNLVTQLDPLAQLTALRVLDLSRNPITRLAPLSSLFRLRELFLEGIGIFNLASLQPLAELQILFLADNFITNLNTLAGLTRLRVLELARNDVSDLSPLANLRELTALGLSDNDVSDLSPVADLTRLQLLYVGGNRIVSLEPVRNLTALEDFQVNSNQVERLDALAGLTALRILNVSSNRIRILTPLVGNTGLGVGDQVNATSNDLIEATCPDIAALRERGVTILIDDEVTQLCGF